jgi:DNA-binding transcriptional MerR regulator
VRELTIDEFAQRLGMTTRNIRECQALGLMPPPRKRSRSGVVERAARP